MATQPTRQNEDTIGANVTVSSIRYEKPLYSMQNRGAEWTAIFETDKPFMTDRRLEGNFGQIERPRSTGSMQLGKIVASSNARHIGWTAFSLIDFRKNGDRITHSSGWKSREEAVRKGLKSLRAYWIELRDKRMIEDRAKADVRIAEEKEQKQRDHFAAIGPELLEALEAHEKALNYRAISGRDWVKKKAGELTRIARIKSRDAIAKARGQS